MIDLLHVHAIAHPRSERGAALAKKMWDALNADTRVPSLRVPVFYAPTTDSGTPPQGLPLRQAELELYLVLVDMSMVAADARNRDHAWGDFAGELWSACSDPAGRTRCIPVSLDDHAFNLSSKLDDASFLRAKDSNEEVEHRVLNELCRMVLHEPLSNGESPPPLELFLSHAKFDLRNESEDSPVHRFWRFLNQESPVRAWMDSTAIPSGANARTEIDVGIGRSTVIAFETDHYSDRAWCQYEVVSAKTQLRPMVRVDALRDGAQRSFPYLGNMPSMPWHPGATLDEDRRTAERLITLCLKETLRTELARRRLKKHQLPGDRVFPRPVEALDEGLLTSGGAQLVALQPDPPFGNPETELLKARGMEVTTPTERMVRGHRSLHGREVALSFSDAPDTGRFGMGCEHLYQVALDLCRYLLIQGARLTYGGHLRAGGFTVEVLDLVRRHNDWAKAIGNQEAALEPIHVALGWPLRPGDADYARYGGYAGITEVAMPSSLEDLGFNDPPRPFPDFENVDDTEAGRRRVGWAHGMTAMREFVTAGVHARILMGGQLGRTPAQASASATDSNSPWYKGKLPGLVEEALCTLRHPEPQPLFLIGAFGGATNVVIDLLQGRTRPEWSFAWQCSNPWYREMAERLGARVATINGKLVDETAGDWVSYDELASELAGYGLARLRNGLTDTENQELFTTRALERIIELVTKGLSASVAST